MRATFDNMIGPNQTSQTDKLDQIDTLIQQLVADLSVSQRGKAMDYAASTSGIKPGVNEREVVLLRLFEHRKTIAIAMEEPAGQGTFHPTTRLLLSQRMSVIHDILLLKDRHLLARDPADTVIDWATQLQRRISDGRVTLKDRRTKFAIALALYGVLIIGLMYAALVVAGVTDFFSSPSWDSENVTSTLFRVAALVWLLLSAFILATPVFNAIPQRRVPHGPDSSMPLAARVAFSLLIVLTVVMLIGVAVYFIAKELGANG